MELALLTATPSGREDEEQDTRSTASARRFAQTGIDLIRRPLVRKESAYEDRKTNYPIFILTAC